jgi:hypothetical protein
LLQVLRLFLREVQPLVQHHLFRQPHGLRVAGMSSIPRMRHGSSSTAAPRPRRSRFVSLAT